MDRCVFNGSVPAGSLAGLPLPDAQAGQALRAADGTLGLS